MSPRRLEVAYSAAKHCYLGSSETAPAKLGALELELRVCVWF